MISCILLAAGSGTRMGLKTNKVYLKIGNKTLLEWCLLTLKKVKNIAEIIVVVAADEVENASHYVNKIKLDIPIKIVIGGATRQESVQNGINSIELKDVVLIHDAARPMASVELFEIVAEAVQKYGAAIPGLPVIDTIKEVEDDTVISNPERSRLWRVQTPQGFKYEHIKKALEIAQNKYFLGTDDASLMPLIGVNVHVVAGVEHNIKITTPHDLILARHYLGAHNMKVGMGYDIHRFTENRPCILGGIKIDSNIGLDGHSDADVLVHALMDAILGAAGLRDIGYYFPPTDDTFKNISSLILLERVIDLVKNEGYIINNVDITVIAEKPRINPHVDRMKATLAPILQIEVNSISIKATTNEGLGSIGRLEGIAAQAIATIIEREEF